MISHSLLLDNDSLANCPNWSTAIEVILANNLPIKFALRGHLETSDCVTNEFYATKKIWTNYRRLRQIFCSECSARRPIFLCNFELTPSDSNLSLTSAKLSNEQSVIFNNRPLDRQLPDYLRILREALEIAGLNERQTPERPRTLDDIRRCVELISDVVCTKICSRPYEPPENEYDLLAVESFGSLMSGETDCTCTDDLDDVIQRHLDELKREQYDCNVIPLGAVRVGGFFEKSLLFKVLADKIGLPCGWRMCALDNRVVWNEIYMPDMDSVSAQNCEYPIRTPIYSSNSFLFVGPLRCNRRESTPYSYCRFDGKTGQSVCYWQSTGATLSTSGG